MLYEFYGLECPHCQKMRTLSDKLIKEFRVAIERKEVWHNKENMELIKKYDSKNECDGVPFFYNDLTKAWQWGAVIYDEMKRLAEF